MNATFHSLVKSPPGGLWFWEDGDFAVSSPSYHDAVDRIRAHFAETGRTDSPAEALAAYMCPRMPRGFCANFSGPRETTISELLAKTSEYSSMPVESADVIMARLDRCAKCPRHARKHCVTCHGIAARVFRSFGGRRAPVPQDVFSGVCECAGTYAMTVASVVYGEGGPEWRDVPETCWRNDR